MVHKEEKQYQMETDRSSRRQNRVNDSSGKITIYSKITYHLIGLDKYIDVMCQISSSSNCGSGEVSSTVSLQINPSELQGIFLKLGRNHNKYVIKLLFLQISI